MKAEVNLKSITMLTDFVESRFINMDSLSSIGNKKVALVFHDDGMSGGTLALLDLINSWKKDNIEFVCILPKKNEEMIKILSGNHVQVVSYRYWQSVCHGDENFIKRISIFIKFFLSMVTTFFMCLTTFRRMNIGVVYTNTSSIYVGAWISEILRVPHIWHIREFISREHGMIPILGEKLHYTFINSKSSEVIVISKSLYEECVKYVNPNHLHMVYDDVSDFYRNVNSKHWDYRKNKLLFVGNISPGKGQLVAVEAMRILKEKNENVILKIAGRPTDKVYYETLKDKIRTYGLMDRICFLGQVSDMNLLREDFGIGIVASKKEAFGRVTIEGMLGKMIMVGAMDAGTSELIVNGENGFLFELNNEEQLADQIMYIINADYSEIDSMINKAISFAQEFSCGAGAGRILSIFKDYMLIK